MDRHDEEGDVAIECGREPPVRSRVALGGAESKIGADFKVHLRSNRNILLLWYRWGQSVLRIDSTAPGEGCWPEGFLIHVGGML